MRVLLGLGDVQLGASGLGDHLRERRAGPLRRERGRQRRALGVLGERRVAGHRLEAAAVEAVEPRVGERGGQLAHAVRPEVEGDDAVPRADPVTLPHAGGDDELVALPAPVGVADRSGRARGPVGGILEDEHPPRGLDAVPAAVAVHGVEAADDAPHAGVAGLLAPALDRLQVAGSGVRRRVAAVGEGVDDHLGNAEVGGHPDQRLQVLHARVDPAVADQADQVEALGVAHSVDEDRVLVELAVGHGIVDPGQVLAHHRAGAEVEVADLAVAHLALRQADRPTGGRERGVRVALEQSVEDGGVGLVDGVPGAGPGQPPPVENDQAAGGGAHCAAETIAAKEAGSSEAPPTSAPSMSGIASSSAALSGFTEPP